MTKSFIDKFLITVLIILGLFIVYDVVHKVISNSDDKDSSQKIVKENSYVDKSNQDNNYRVNSNKKRQLSKDEVRESNRYIEDLNYALEDAGLTINSFSSDIEVSFKIDKNGEIECCTVEQSSGSTKIDNIVMKRIRSINPYRPLPDYYGNKMLVKVSYGLNKKGMTNIPIYNE